MQHKLDLRGAIVPYSLLKVIQALKLMETGEMLEVAWSDPDAPADLFKVLPDSSYELISLEETADSSPAYRLKLIKKQSIKLNKEAIMTDLSSIEISNTVDARGSACPGPLLEAKKGIGKVKVGEVLEIFSSDSGTRNDIPAWAKKVGHEYLGLLEVDGYDKHYVRRNK
jgi:tRNA 2-thiouridine synthesizing protein A